MEFPLQLALVVSALIFIAQGCVYNGRECPDYTIVSQHADYEVRAYPSLVWATTSETSDSLRVATYTMFMRLFRYISGENVRDQKINMTVPVRTIASVEDGEGQKTYNMSFMVPSSLGDDAPLPYDRRVVINREDPIMYVARTFSGYVWRQRTWQKEAKVLNDSIGDDTTVDRSNFYMAGYDAPYKLFNRRNEVWMVKHQNETDNEIF